MGGWASSEVVREKLQRHLQPPAPLFQTGWCDRHWAGLLVRETEILLVTPWDSNLTCLCFHSVIQKICLLIIPSLPTSEAHCRMSQQWEWRGRPIWEPSAVETTVFRGARNNWVWFSSFYKWTLWGRGIHSKLMSLFTKLLYYRLQAIGMRSRNKCMC